MTPISVTTHEFSTKVLRRGRTKQLKRLISLIKLYFNYLYILSPTIFGIITPHISIVSNKNSISLHRNRTDEEQRDTVIARRTIVRRGNLIPDPQIATASMKPRNDRGKTIINISITYIWFHQPKMSESPTIYVHITNSIAFFLKQEIRKRKNCMKTA